MFLQKARDPAFWQKVRTEASYASLRKECMDIWENCASKPMPELRLQDYLRFFGDGDRAVYEFAYFARRRALCATAMLSLVYPDKPEYLRRLEDIIYAIATEYTWCLPAHQLWDGEKMDVIHIDLFAAETGWALAETYDLLGERLQPFVRRLIRDEVERRIIFSFLDGKGTTPWEAYVNNWASVCAGSVSAAILYLRPDLYPRAEARIDACMEKFLGGYGDDGFCAEGVGYWNYGFGFYIAWADLIRDFTGGKRNEFARPKVKSIAAYLQKIFLSGNTVVSFADGSRTAMPNACINDFLRGEYGDYIQYLAPATPTCCDHCGRFCLFMRGAVWRNETRLPDEPASPIRAGECYAPDAEWFIKATASYGFAAKAGHNEEFHNHCDVGGFIIAKDGKQVFCDVGAPLYDRGFFRGETRYSYFHSSSRGHSVPHFGQGLKPNTAALQKDGRQYAASDVQVSEGHFALEMAGAYAVEGVRSARRAFTLSDTTVSLCDTFDVAEGIPVTERFIFLEKPCLKEGGFEVGGLDCHFETPLKDVQIYQEEISIHDSKATETAWVLDAAPQGQTFRMTVQTK